LRIFGPKRDDVTGEWRKLHKRDLYALYFSTHIIRVIKSRRLRWAGHVASMGERRGAYRVLVVRREERRTLGRPRHIWEHNIKTNLKKAGWVCGLIENRDKLYAFVNVVMNLRVS
jgi:hypothetical protein